MLNNASSFAASILRLGFGTDIAAGARVPDRRLILYDFEACPFCRKAREALSHLGLEVEVRPAASDGRRREELKASVERATVYGTYQLTHPKQGGGISGYES